MARKAQQSTQIQTLVQANQKERTEFRIRNETRREQLQEENQTFFFIFPSPHPLTFHHWKKMTKENEKLRSACAVIGIFQRIFPDFPSQLPTSKHRKEEEKRLRIFHFYVFEQKREVLNLF